MMTLAQELIEELNEKSVNIASAEVKDLLQKMRDAIDRNDRKEEDKFRKQLNKAMMKVAKPVIKQAFSELKKTLKSMDKELSKQTGLDVETFTVGTPAPTIGTGAKPKAVKGATEVVFTVDVPE